MRFLGVILLGAVLGCVGLLAAEALDDGIAHFKSHRFPAADVELTAAVEADADDGAAAGYLALTLAELKRPEDALARREAAAALEAPADLLEVVDARLAMDREELEQALETLNAALEVHPESSLALHYRGLAQLMKKNYAAATADLEKSLELDPAFPYTHYYLGMAYNGLKRPDRSVAHLQQFVQAAPDAPDADKVRSLLRAFR